MLESINTTAVDGILPDLTLLLDLDSAEGLKRAKGRAQDSDSFEKEDSDFHKRLRAGFLEIAKNTKEAFIVLNAAQSPSDVFAQAKPALEAWLRSMEACK